MYKLIVICIVSCLPYCVLSDVGQAFGEERQEDRLSQFSLPPNEGLSKENSTIMPPGPAHPSISVDSNNVKPDLVGNQENQDKKLITNKQPNVALSFSLPPNEGLSKENSTIMPPGPAHPSISVDSNNVKPDLVGNQENQDKKLITNKQPNVALSEDDDEELYPNLPLSLDDNILNERYNNFLKEKGTRANVGRGGVEKKEDDEIVKDKGMGDDVVLDDIITPSKKKSDNFSFWVISDKTSTIKKKFVMLPQSISRKKYSDINQGLPQAIYITDYKRLLFKEVKHNNINGVRALLDRIQDLDFRDANGNTPLLYAVNQSKVDMIHLLLAKGADITAKNLDKQGVYDIVLKNGRFDILNVLDAVKA